MERSLIKEFISKSSSVFVVYEGQRGKVLPEGGPDDVALGGRGRERPLVGELNGLLVGAIPRPLAPLGLAELLDADVPAEVGPPDGQVLEEVPLKDVIFR